MYYYINFLLFLGVLFNGKVLKNIWWAVMNIYVLQIVLPRQKRLLPRQKGLGLNWTDKRERHQEA